MNQSDFDLASLAVYLHITPQQVEKLASRGKVPGRKVQGKWVFSFAEIHHWMEERMGLLEEAELQKVEERLQERVSEMPLARMLRTESIAIPLRAKTKRSVIEEMVALAAETGMLWDTERMEEAIRAGAQTSKHDIAFHRAILHSTHNPMTIRVGETLLQLIEAALETSMRSLPETALKDHKAIYAAFKAGDTAGIHAAIAVSSESWETNLTYESDSELSAAPR